MAKPELRDHRKFLKLCRILQAPAPHVLGYLDFMWHRGYQTGNPFLGDADDVEAAAAFVGERGAFARAAVESGFLDTDHTGQFVIHDLWEHAPKYAKARIERAGFKPNVEQSGRPRSQTGQYLPENDTIGKDAATNVASMVTNVPTVVPPNPNPNPNPKPEDRIHSDATASGREADRPPKAKRTSKPKPEPKPRDPWPTYEAVAEVTGCSGSHVAKVARELESDESPPVTPEEIRDFGKRFAELCPHVLIDGVPRFPNVGELRKYVLRVRASPPQALPNVIRPSQMSFKEREHARADALLESFRAKPQPDPFDALPEFIEPAELEAHHDD